MRKTTMLCAVALMSMASALWADPPTITAVETTKFGMGWRFSVTIAHPDTGWDHYADGWDVVDAAGNVLGSRELMHPHVTEQPFTRSLSNVFVPDGSRTVFIRARCSRDGWASEMFEVDLSP